MKSCSICSQNYNDDNLNFCLNDGGVLIESKDDAPPTIQMNYVRTTDPNFSDHQPSSPWGSQPLQQQQSYPQQSPQPFGQPYYSMMPAAMSQKQTLAVVSLCLGIASVTIGWCCYVGMLLSPAALITGFIALSQIKKDPQANGGRGLAIGGIVTGAVYLGLLLIIIMIYGIAIFFGGLR